VITNTWKGASVGRMAWLALRWGWNSWNIPGFCLPMLPLWSSLWYCHIIQQLTCSIFY